MAIENQPSSSMIFPFKWPCQPCLTTPEGIAKNWPWTNRVSQANQHLVASFLPQQHANRVQDLFHLRGKERGHQRTHQGTVSPGARVAATGAALAGPWRSVPAPAAAAPCGTAGPPPGQLWMLKKGRFTGWWDKIRHKSHKKDKRY